MSESVELVPAMAHEIRSLALRDARLTARFQAVLEAVARRPAAPFPKAMGSPGAIQAFYRFCRNKGIAMHDVLEPHFRRTVERLREQPQVVIVHDSTHFTPASASTQTGFYEVARDTLGLTIHIALALSVPSGLPLGLLDAITVAPPPKDHAKAAKSPRTNRADARKTWKDPHKRSRRWFETVATVTQRLGPGAEPLHVMDSEADSYELFHHIRDQRFVVRLKHDRVIPADAEHADEGPAHAKLFEALDAAPILLEREVSLAARKAHPAPKGRKAHPPREARLAKLSILAKRVSLPRPPGLPKAIAPLGPLYAVAVREQDAPLGAEPVSWNLLTSEPVTCAEEAAGVVDAYGLRWRVEEYFDVLKNGCALNQRLPESRTTAEGMLAPLLIVAWQLLWLRAMERVHARGRADEVFPKERLRILRARIPPRMLPPRASVRHVMAALAWLGGHHRSNGPPGWRVLARGYLEFLEFEEGWRAAEMALRHYKRPDTPGGRGRGRCV